LKQGLSAVFADPDHAERAVVDLVGIGVPRDWIQIRSLGPEDRGGTPLAAVTGAHRVALICAVIAAVVSAVLAMLMTVGVVPAAGFEFLGTSTLGAAARGMIAGGGVGALFGYILGMGMWDSDGEPEVPVLASEVLLTLRAGDQGEGVRSILTRAGGRIV